MFVRFKTSSKSKNPTIQIVESVRKEDGKVRQKVISSLGVVKDEEDKNRLVNLAYNLINKLQTEKTGQLSFPMEDQDYKHKPFPKKSPNPSINYKNLKHVKDFQCGFSDVFGQMSKEVGFDKVLLSIDKTSRNKFGVLDVIKMLLARRIQEPESKRSSFFHEITEKGHCSFSLHHIYRAMDAIEPYTKDIQDKAYYAALNIFPEVNSYFYDATTLFFESVNEDGIRGFGFSKDCKFNQTQIVLCLLVTDNGLPVGYELFKGNTSETNTLRPVIESLSKRYVIKSHTIVCDRGMLSKDNLSFIESKDSAMYFIVGEKLRKIPAKFHQTIFDKSDYDCVGDTLVKYIPHPTRVGAKLLLGFSESRANKDKKDRERLLKKLINKFDKKKTVKTKDFINNTGIRKYVTIDGGDASLNKKAISKDAIWDGYFGIVTNNPDLTSEQILNQYRGLWQVEANFRVLKNELSTRPIFHWTEKRIRAHVLICFMSLVLERHLYLKLRFNKTPLTSKQIYDSLRMCKKIVLQEQNTFRLFEIDSTKPIEAQKIYEVVGLNWRSTTTELTNPEKNVVPTSLSVIP